MYTYHHLFIPSPILQAFGLCGFFSFLNPFHWKDWCWSWSSNTLVTWCEEPSHWKRPQFWERLRARGEGTTDDELVGWHHWLHGHEFEQTLGDSEGQGSLACCNSRGCRVGHDWVTEQQPLFIPSSILWAFGLCGFFLFSITESTAMTLLVYVFLDTYVQAFLLLGCRI